MSNIIAFTAALLFLVTSGSNISEPSGKDANTPGNHMLALATIAPGQLMLATDDVVDISRAHPGLDDFSPISSASEYMDDNSKVAENFSLKSFGLGSHPPVMQEGENQSLGMVYETKNGYAEFYCEAIGTVGIFTGASNSLESHIDFQDNSITLSLELKTLNTGIEQRDALVYKTLNTDRHPTAIFKGSFEIPFDHYSKEKQYTKASGQFTMHGMARNLEFEGYLQNSGEGISLKAEWILNLEDFGITPPRIFNVLIDGEQQISIEALMNPRPVVSLSASR